MIYLSKIEWMKVTYRGHIWKVGLGMKKTQIYQTIEGLIILFIKLQFSIRCNQAFGPIAYLNLQHLTQPQIIYLNLSLNSQRPTGLVTCIILMHSYYPDTSHDSRRAPAEVSASDQVRSRPMYSLGLGATWSATKEAFVIFIRYSDFPEDEADVCTREKS